MLVAIEGMPIRIDGRLHAITASIGVRALPAATGELPAADVLMADADQACYEAKRCGRNRLVVAYQ
jgi:GGDEF domain-containing protein